MARNLSTGKRPFLSALPFVFSLIAALLAIIVLVAGSRSNVLDELSFFKVDTSNFDIESKLSGSAYLQDLTEVSGLDLVGQDVTAESLGLARTYTVSLLGSCSHDTDSTSCTSPRVGYVFDPISVFKLDTVSISSLTTDTIEDALSKYERISRALAFAYMAGIISTILGPILAAFGSKLRLLGIAGAFFSWLAMGLLLGSSAAGQYIYRRFSKAIDSDLDPIGIDSDLGLLLVPSWLAFGFALLAAILTSFTPRGSPARGHPDLAFDNKNKSGPNGFITGQANVSSGPGAGFLNKVQTWGRQKYVGIGKQSAGEHNGAASVPRAGGARSGNLSDDEEHLVPRDQGDAYGSHRESLQFEPRGLPSRASTDDGHGGQGDIAMMPLGNKGHKDMNTAYEPYSSRY
ncbi:hypothetical protein ACHAQA_007127 [Verticillium albo-atrum]